MKSIKQIFYSLVLSMTLVLISPTLIPFSNQVIQTEAAAKINKSKVTLIKGQTVTLKINGTSKKAKWSSNKKSIATVTQKGKVTAKKTGTAKITAKIGSKKYTCTIKVQAPKINKSKVTINAGNTYTLKISGTDQKITWKSSNTSVATVNNNGVVTAKKKGTVTITATILNKNYTCKVTVKKPASTSNQVDASISGSVWIPTNGGTKYHSTSTCSGMVNPSYVTLEEAISLGFDACKKCH